MNKKIRIIATLGPATSAEDVLSSLVDAGADIVRLNFSWGTRESMQSLIDAVRQIEQERGVPVPILQDLSGPRVQSNGGHTHDPASAVIADKDKNDLTFGLDNGVEYVALSFVSSAQDIHDLRQLMVEHGQVTPVIAKIERKEALENFDEIVDAADGVMIARGDLGTVVPLEELPSIEKKIISICNQKEKFVIVATQMMVSMVDSSSPTRAEVMDVATAIGLGADAVMLSEETSLGHHPVETVAMMRKIVDFAEDERESPHDNF